MGETPMKEKKKKSKDKSIGELQVLSHYFYIFWGGERKLYVNLKVLKHKLNTFSFLVLTNSS